MMQHQVTPPRGARRNRKRIGRGDAAGQGSTAGRGMKGQKSRSGRGPRLGFEGGQLPIIKALPMRRGFTNIFKTYYTLVKLETLDSFDAGDVVTPEVLAERGYIRNLNRPVKIVGGGELTKSLQVLADKFTRTAREAIEASKGTAEEISAR
jgi:large subunit ribosomal protein L15